VLAILLAVWEPLNLALFLAPRLLSVAVRGWEAVTLLVVRLLVAGLGIAAGTALWQKAPQATVLATAALILSTIAAAVTLGTSILPSNLPPGDAPFWIALIAAHNGAWLFYLWRFTRR
jgi:hypothetical protein